MQTLKLTKNDFDFNKVYIGSVDVTDYNGNIEIESDLNTVCFLKDLKASGWICTGHRTGIYSSSNIIAGLSINVGGLINAKYSIVAGQRVNAGWAIYANNMNVGWGISAGDDIKIKKEIKLGQNNFVIAGANSFHNRINEIHCTNLIGGQVKFGKLVLIKEEF